MSWLVARLNENSTKTAIGGAITAAIGAWAGGLPWQFALGAGAQALLQAVMKDSAPKA